MALNYSMVQKARENAYKILLPGDMHIFATFNIGDLTPYIDDEHEHDEDLRANTIHYGG